MADEGGEQHAPAQEHSGGPSEPSDAGNTDSRAATDAHEQRDSQEGATDKPGSTENAIDASGTGSGDGSEPASPHASAPPLESSTSSLALPKSDPFLSIDPDITSPDELVAMLRGQITDLTGQVTSLNSKLIKSYTQRGEIEDDLHDIQEEHTILKMKHAELERERDRWTKEIEAGGWVERNHVQGEMQRLMSTVLEETKSRETAVKAHTALETEIENLTSNLFSEANKMVAFERLGRARAEEKARSVEEAGVSMQALLEEVQVGLKDTVLKLEERDAQVADLKRKLAAHGEPVEEDEDVTGEGASEKDAGLGGVVFSDGERLAPLNTRQLSSHSLQTTSPSPLAAPRILTAVLPYEEFLAFIHYLRQTRITALSRPPPEHSSYSTLGARGHTADVPPPEKLTPDQLLAPHLLLSTHLSQAFLKRCVEEDSDPALRLDIAPGLGFLSRRGVGTAVVDGTLVIEPLSVGAELPSDKCALCGCSLERWLRNSGFSKGARPTTSAAQIAAASVNSTMRKISSSFFSRTASSSTVSSNLSLASPALPPRGSQQGRTLSQDDSFNFPPASTSASHHPHDAFLVTHVFRTSDKSQSQRYAICPSYCLPRLRAVCEFWTYVRVLLRGLLLEESFRFGQLSEVKMASAGAAASSQPMTPAASRSSNGHGIPEVEEEKGAAAETGGEGGQLADEPGTGVEAKDFEAEDTHAEEGDAAKGDAVPQEKDEDEEKAAEEDKKDGVPEIVTTETTETTEAGGDDDKKEEEVDPSSGKEQDAEGSTKSQEGSENDSRRTSTEGGGSVSRSSSIKPPRPARSSARNTPKPASTPSPPASPALEKPRPALPPRLQPGGDENPAPAPSTPPARPTPLPRHPSYASSDVAQLSRGGAAPSPVSASAGSGWEDRCWNEVIRLKEAVFWTRVAAVAPGGEAVSSRGARVWQ